MASLDFSKAYDTVWMVDLWKCSVGAWCPYMRHLLYCVIPAQHEIKGAP